MRLPCFGDWIVDEPGIVRTNNMEGPVVVERRKRNPTETGDI